MSALIFDCDGVLADTERYGHLPAFNRMFEEFALPVRWDEAEYGRLLAIGGGKERIRSILTPELLESVALPSDGDHVDSAVACWHRRKTEIYGEIVRSGQLPPRPGIPRIIGAARAAGWPVAVASTSARRSVEAVVQHAVPKHAEEIAIFAGDVVPSKKPAPDIYLLALGELGLDRSSTVVIEDSRNGLRAAVAAGLPCVVTVNGYTRDEAFGEAELVVSSLGDPGAEPIEVLARRAGRMPGAYVTLDDLATYMRTTVGGA